MILLAPLSSFAQSVERQVIASTGTATISATGMQVSQTVGQPMVKSYPNASIIVSEGFQQGNSNSVGAVDFNPETVSIKVFPNPVTDQLSLEIETSDPLQLQLSFLDVLGKEIQLPNPQLRVIGATTETIDCSQLAAGTYFLRLQDVKSSAVKSIRIEKIR